MSDSFVGLALKRLRDWVGGIYAGCRCYLWPNFKHPEETTRAVLYKKGILKKFAKLTGKHLCQSLFFKKVKGVRPGTLLKNRLWHRCFPVNFAKFLRAPVLQNTYGRLLLNNLVSVEKVTVALGIKITFRWSIKMQVTKIAAIRKHHVTTVNIQRNQV